MKHFMYFYYLIATFSVMVGQFIGQVGNSILFAVSGVVTNPKVGNMGSNAYGYEPLQIGSLGSQSIFNAFDPFSENGNPKTQADRWSKFLSTKEVGDLASMYSMNSGSNPISSALSKLSGYEVGAISGAKRALRDVVAGVEMMADRGNNVAAKKLDAANKIIDKAGVNLAVMGTKTDDAALSISQNQSERLSELVSYKAAIGVDAFVCNLGMINPSKMTAYTDFKLHPDLVKDVKRETWLSSRFNFYELVKKASVNNDATFNFTTTNTANAAFRRVRIEVSANGQKADQALEGNFTITFYDALAQTTVTLPIWYFKYSYDAATVRFSIDFHLHTWDTTGKRLLPTYGLFSDLHPIAIYFANLDDSSTVTCTIIGSEHYSEGNI